MDTSAMLKAMRENNSASIMAMFGEPLEVRPCLCYWHGDPKSIYFD